MEWRPGGKIEIRRPNVREMLEDMEDDIGMIGMRGWK